MEKFSQSESSRDSFSPYDYINEKLVDANLPEIKETIKVLAEGIEKKKEKSKELISSHFIKFVQCRNTLEEIRRDTKSHASLEAGTLKRLKGHIDMLTTKYSSISKNIFYDLQQESMNSRKLYLQHEFEDIFELQQNLQANMGNYENFVMIYRRALRKYNEYSKSRVLTERMNDCRPILNRFADQIYEYILTNELNFKEACYYFDLYFEVTESKSDRKIMNTMFVCFKESTTSSAWDLKGDSTEEYMNYLEESLFKFIGYVDKDVKKEGILHYFECLKNGVEDVVGGRVLYKRARLMRPTLNLDLELGGLYDKLLSKSKVSSFLKISRLSKDSIEDSNESSNDREEFEYFEPMNLRSVTELNGKLDWVAKTYDKYVEILSGPEVRSCQEVILARIKEEIDGCGFEDEFDVLKLKVKNIRRCLGSENSRLNKELNGYLKKKKRDVLDKTANTLEELINDPKLKSTDADEAKINSVKVLMFVVRVLEETTRDDLKLMLFKVRNDIAKHPPLEHYLSAFITPKNLFDLTGNDRKIIQQLKEQFSFLLSL